MKSLGLRVFPLVIPVLIFGANVAFAEAPDTLWTRTYGGTSWDVGYSAQQTSDGGYIIAGYTLSFGDPYGDVYLIKTNENGDTSWTRRYAGLGEDGARSVRQTQDGGYIVAGQTASIGGYYDVYLIKTDPLGNMTWSETYGGSGSDVAWDVQQTSDGGYIMTGVTSSFGNDRDVYLIKTLNNGTEDWSQHYGGTEWEYGHSVQQTSDGGYIIVGYTNSSGAGGDDVYLIKTDASGNTVFPPKTFGGTGNEQGHSVRQTSDGGYIIAAHTWSYGAGGSDVYLIKTNGNCDPVWTRTYGGSGNDWGYSVQQTNDSGYVVAGYTYSYGGGAKDIYIVKTDEYGDTSWTKTCGGVNDEEGYVAQQTSDRGYIIAGYTASFGSGGNDVYLVRLIPPMPELGFYPDLDGWGFGNTGVNMWPESWWSQFDYTQPPYPPWFQFIYGLTSSSVFPDWPLFVAAFGEAQCYYDPPLVFSIEATNVWSSIIGPWQGSCFGFAISSLLIFDGYLNIETVFPGYDWLYTVPIEDTSRLVVNKYFVYQFGESQQQHINENWLTTTPVQTLSACNSMFANPGLDDRILVMFNNHGTGGHAVIPYKSETDSVDENIRHLYVYDCNFPGDESKRILINTNTNTWSYDVFPGWGGDKFLFLMDTLMNYITNPIMPKSILPRDKGVVRDSSKLSDYVKIYVTPTEDALLESQSGSIGRIGDSLFSTLTDGFPIIPITGQETPPIGYYLPNDIWNSQFSDIPDSIFWLSILTESTVISYWRSDVGVDDTEELRYPGDDSTFLVLNPDGEDHFYDVHVISICPDSEIFYIVNDILTEPGDSNRYSVKPGSRLQLDNYGGDKLYNLRIEIPSENGSPVFLHEDIMIAENSSHLVIPDWRQNDDTLIILVDPGMTGDFSDTNSYDNEVGIDINENTQTLSFISSCEPNPFRDILSIEYILARRSEVQVMIYDLLGREVRKLLDIRQDAGVHTIIWDGGDNCGRRVPSGIYFVRFNTGKYNETRKIMMMR